MGEILRLAAIEAALGNKGGDPFGRGVGRGQRFAGFSVQQAKAHLFAAKGLFLIHSRVPAVAQQHGDLVFSLAKQMGNGESLANDPMGGLLAGGKITFLEIGVQRQEKILRDGGAVDLGRKAAEADDMKRGGGRCFGQMKALSDQGKSGGVGGGDPFCLTKDRRCIFCGFHLRGLLSSEARGAGRACP